MTTPANVAPSGQRISFGLPGVAPPSPLYITRDDRLVISLVGAEANVIQINVRLLTADGDVVFNAFQVTSPANRVWSSQAFSLAEGFLLSVDVPRLVGTVPRGRNYCEVALFRGLGTEGALPQATVLPQMGLTLISGYVSSWTGLSWPNGRLEPAFGGRGQLRSITGTNPAAGQDVTETVPSGAIWRLISLQVQLVTDATLGGRRVQFALDDGANRFYSNSCPDLQNESLAVTYSLAHVGTGVSSVSQFKIVAAPLDLYLSFGFRIRTLTTGLVAGDDFGPPQMLVEEWLSQ